MIKFLRALKSEQRKLWSKGSILGCFVLMFLLSFAFSFLCSVVRYSGGEAAELFLSEHAQAAFTTFDDRTPWREQVEQIIEDCDDGIADTAALLADAEGSDKVLYERRMEQFVEQKEIAQYRLDNSLPLRDWSGYYALVLCLWMMIPAAGVIATVYASDMFAGEYSRGTVRMILSRPVTRLKIYAAKLISALLLGWLLLGVAYGAAGIGCGVLMSPSDGKYVGCLNGTVYSSTWGQHLFSVFLCGCGMVAVVIALCAAVGNITRSRGASAVCAVVLALAGMVTGQISGLIDSGAAGVLLPFCFDLTVPLCGVAYNSQMNFATAALSMGIHFIAFAVAGYSGFRKDV